LGGELADILPQLESIPRILVHRDLNPEYVRAKDLQRFVAENFDLVLIPGEIGELPLAQLPQVNHTAPWLFKSAGELPNRADARALLRLDSSEGKVVLVCAAGRAEELSFYGQLTRDLANSLPDVTVRCLSAECPKNCPPQLWVFHWPGIDCLPAADVVVGGAGYNTFYECVSVGVPLVAFAFKRQYDRQQMRASRWCHQEKLPPVRLVKSAQEAQIAIADFLQLPGCNPPSFINGAIAAVQIIEYATASLLLKPSW
jgi:UDP:flavonoid glycosyltransferase YjiC (YdhE family)